MGTIGQTSNPAVRPRRTPKWLILAAAAAILTLPGAAQTASAIAGWAPHHAPTGSARIAADGDDNFVNDNGQTSGDIFQQNAQDQSTA
jgi:hypothetical protein